MNLRRLFPIIEQLKGYSKATFSSDLIAGLTVSIMLIPQGMAYALLTGVDPVYGLYCGLIPLFLYGIFGTSRQLSIGPVAVSSLLVFAGISQLETPETPAYLQLVILAGFLIGLMHLLVSVLRLGFLVNFLSYPVIRGFTSAAAIIIAVSQLKHLLGIEIPRFEYTYETVHFAINHLAETHLLSFAICGGALLLMLFLKRWLPAVPGALVVTIIGVLAAMFFELDQQGLAIVGEVPAGLPNLMMPEFNEVDIRRVMPTVLTVAIMGIVESVSIGKAIELKNKTNHLRPNQEFFALGISKIVGAFLQAIPSSASFSRSAVNNEAGAKTGIASIVAASVTGLTLLFFTPLFFYLPKAVLAAIILMAIRNLFEYKNAMFLWKTDKKDFCMLLATFSVTLILGIEEGVLTGVVLSLLLIVFQASQPHYTVLGRLPRTKYFRNIHRFPQAIQTDGVLILRFDAPLFFLNTEAFKKAIRNLVQKYDGKIKLLILDASSILEVDSSGLECFEEICDYLQSEGIELYVAGLIGPVRDRFHKAGLMEKVGEKQQFLAINEALSYFQRLDKSSSENWTQAAVQASTKKRKKKPPSS